MQDGGQQEIKSIGVRNRTGYEQKRHRSGAANGGPAQWAQAPTEMRSNFDPYSYATPHAYTFIAHLFTGRLNARVMETTCEHRCVESACKKPKVKLEVINSQSFKRRVTVARPDVFNY